MKRLGALLALLAAGCLDVADDRARRDQQVGQSSAEGISVFVTDGLASVRRLDRQGLTLWAGAPALNVRVSFPMPAPATFTLAVDNAMPAAVLRGPPGVVTIDSAVPTERRWSFTPPPAGGEVVLEVAPPDAASPGPFRFAAMADVQEAIGTVQDIIARLNQEPELRFVVFNGDLTRWGNTDELLRFQREFKVLTVPVFATLGNHELGNDTPPYHQIFGRGNFRFLYRGVQFTLLDSASATLAPLTYDWLEGWLAEGQGRLHLVGMHVPPIDPVGVRNGSFASRAEAARLLAMLAGGGVDLTLYGHIHSYYSFWNAGIPAYISGGGGSLPERFDGVGRHFLVLDADPSANVVKVRTVRVD